jgi:thioredoxin
MRHALYFTADWCNPCERTRPIVEELNKDSSVKFQFIDADDNSDLCKKFSIKSIPTFILIENGKEINRMNGAKTKDQLEEFINGAS